MSDGLEHSGGDDGSVSELVEQLGRDASRLAAHEAALSASQRVPELRRALLALAAAVVAVLALAAAFALANWAAVSGLSSVLPTWLAALVLALAWLVVAVVLIAVLLKRAGHASGIEWWRMIGSDRGEAIATLEASRDEAEQALRDTIERLSGALAGAVAGQVAGAVGSLADEAVDMSEDLLEASEDMVDAIEERLPAGGAVGQAIDIVLYPGRLGLRVATTVLKSGSKEGAGSER
jgi:ABC-type multidrug transport system fused ATPase/permease subunit